MLNFLITLGGISLAVSAVVLLMLVLQKPVKKYFTAGCRYIIWSIIIIRLCIPFSLNILPDIISIPEERIGVVTESSPAKNDGDTYIPLAPSVQYTDGEQIPQTEVLAPSTPTTETETSNASEKSFRISQKLITGTVFAVWLLGAACFLGFAVARYISTAHRIDKSLICVNTELLGVYYNVCEEEGIRQPPRLYASSTVRSPMLYGFFRPKIVLPRDILSFKDADTILRHEAVHYVRRDLIFKLLALIANSIHWFNPFAYIASAMLADEMELSCDTRALRHRDKNQRLTYAESMLAIVKRCRVSPVLTTGFNPKKKAVKARFANILDTAKKKKGYTIILCVLILCIVAGSIIGISYSNKDIKDNKDPVQSGEASSESKDTENTHVSDMGENNDIQNDDTHDDPVSSYQWHLYPDPAIEGDIEPAFYGNFDHELRSMGAMILNENQVIGFDGEIKAALPEGSLEYCSICTGLTDHYLTNVDPYTYALGNETGGHGGTAVSYVYDKETGEIYLQRQGGFDLVPEGVTCAVVREESSYHDPDSEDISFGYDGKYGIAVGKEIVVPCVYDSYIGYNNSGIAVLCKDGKWGYFNSRGKQILPFEYSSAVEFSSGNSTYGIPYQASYGYIALCKDGRWGYSDTNGNMVTGFDFLEARPICEGLGWVKTDKGWGVIKLEEYKPRISADEAEEIARSHFNYGVMESCEYIGEKHDYYDTGYYNFHISIRDEYVYTKYNCIITYDGQRETDILEVYNLPEAEQGEETQS